MATTLATTSIEPASDSDSGKAENATNHDSAGNLQTVLLPPEQSVTERPLNPPKMLKKPPQRQAVPATTSTIKKMELLFSCLVNLYNPKCPWNGSAEATPYCE